MEQEHMGKPCQTEYSNTAQDKNICCRPCKGKSRSCWWIIISLTHELIITNVYFILRLYTYLFLIIYFFPKSVAHWLQIHISTFSGHIWWSHFRSQHLCVDACSITWTGVLETFSHVETSAHLFKTHPYILELFHRITTKSLNNFVRFKTSVQTSSSS